MIRTARVSITPNASAPQPQRQRLPVAGKIRPGVKILTAAAKRIPGADTIYKEGVEAGATFEAIEAALRKLPGAPQYPTTPRNSPYFRVNQADFLQPGAAKTLLDLYGEDRGEGVQLYQFPVVFPSDDLDVIFQEQFEAWRASELLHWSEPGPDGLQCMQRQAPVIERARRHRWGGRDVAAVGPCDPNACDLFGSGQCKHNGTLYFWVPGLLGAGLIELAFTSVYASLGIAEIIEMVRAGLGRVRGTWDSKPIFRISKTKESVSSVDWSTGKVGRQDQYIIRLEAALDMVAILSHAEQPAEPPRSAVAALELINPEPPHLAVEYQAEPETPEPEPVAHAAHIEHPAPEPKTELAPQPAAAAEVAKLRHQISAKTRELGWPTEDFTAWAKDQGWTPADFRDAKVLAGVLSRLETILATKDDDVPF